MRRLVTLTVLAITAPLAALAMWCVYLVIEILHAKKKAAPLFPVTRPQRASFAQETQDIMVQHMLEAHQRRRGALQ